LLLLCKHSTTELYPQPVPDHSSHPTSARIFQTRQAFGGRQA
jgi:hypothetical protein